MDMIRLALSDSLSDRVDFGVRPNASEGDKDDTEDWESLWKCCCFAFITSAHSSVSGVVVPALAERGCLLEMESL